jgi:hypothetical protein
VNSLTNFFETQFNNQRDQWEKTLLSELKLTEIGNKAAKKMLSGFTWPTLSLETIKEVQLSSSEWKKASTTYVLLNEGEIEATLTDDIKSGVRNFFFFKEALNEKKWALVEKALKGESDVEVFVLGAKYQSQVIKVVSDFISGAEAHNEGAHAVQELAYLAKNLVQNNDQDSDLYLGVYVDSHFFQNIAKIRAAKLLAHKILKEKAAKNSFKIVALTSFVGWTIFERYSNMLRNETAVASAYIGGADHIQSSGYNSILELETENYPQDDHLERSLRMARNTSHVLGLESMLGIVEDAAFGSYHLENLTQAMCEEAWKLMQKLLQGESLSEDIAKVREARLQMVKTRKTVMSGMNDYPDVKEHLKLKLKAAQVFRVGRPFEELRLRMENSKRPEVCVALYGDYGSLNARLNYVKNYFELLGLTVHERIKPDLSTLKEEIVVLCSLDDKYPNLIEEGKAIKTPYKYIAGKFEMEGLKNLFAGQNVYDVLESIVQTFEGK